MPEITYPNTANNSTLAEKRAALTEGNWIGIAPLVAIAFVTAFIVGVFSYYLITDSFNTGATFQNVGWAGTGSGILMVGITALFSTFVGGALGLAFKTKTASLMAAVLGTLVTGIILYWAYDAAKDSRAWQVLLWAFVGVVGGVILGGFGWKMSKDLAMSEGNSGAAVDRAKYSLYMVVAAAVVGIVAILGYWSMYSIIPSTPAANVGSN